MHLKARVGEIVHFNGCLMGVEDEVRNVETNDAKTGTTNPSSVANVVLADEGGAIQLTLWRKQAETMYPLIEKAMDSTGEGLCAKAKFTHLVLRDVRHSGSNARMLHSTEKN